MKTKEIFLFTLLFLYQLLHSQNYYPQTIAEIENTKYSDNKRKNDSIKRDLINRLYKKNEKVKLPPPSEPVNSYRVQMPTTQGNPNGWNQNSMPQVQGNPNGWNQNNMPTTQRNPNGWNQNNMPQVQGNPNGWNQNNTPTTQENPNGLNQNNTPSTQENPNGWNQNNTSATQGNPNGWSQNNMPTSQGNPDGWNQNSMPQVQGNPDGWNENNMPRIFDPGVNTFIYEYSIVNGVKVYDDNYYSYEETIPFDAFSTKYMISNIPPLSDSYKLIKNGYIYYQQLKESAIYAVCSQDSHPRICFLTFDLLDQRKKVIRIYKTAKTIQNLLNSIRK